MRDDRARWVCRLPWAGSRKSRASRSSALTATSVSPASRSTAGAQPATSASSARTASSSSRSSAPRTPASAGIRTPLADCVAERLRLGQVLELLERVVLDLPDPLAGHAKRAADLLERARLAAEQPVAELDHLAFPPRERAQRVHDVFATQHQLSRVVRRLRGLVLDEVAERRVFLLADRLLERDGELRHAQDLAHLVGRHLELLGDLIRARLASEALHELPLDVHDLVQLLDHVHGDPDGARLVGDRPCDGLPDPPRRVGGELVALAVVELLDSADQTERAFLDQIEKGEPAAEVALGDRDDEAEVGLDHLPLRAHVAALDPLRERHLLVGGEERHLADLAQIEAEGVERRLDCEVELRCDGRFLVLGRRRLVRRRLVPLALDDVDSVLEQVGVEVLGLLLRQLYVLEPAGDLVVGQEAFLPPFRDELVELFDVRKRDVDGEQVPNLPGLGCTTALLQPTETRSPSRPGPPSSASRILVTPRPFVKNLSTAGRCPDTAATRRRPSRRPARRGC